MRIKRHDLSNFSDLGTVVIYPTRTFHYELTGEINETILDFATSVTYLYSTDLNSEYIDFAKYDFKFNLPETDYWSSLVPNLFDYEDTKSKFTEDFDEISENLVPQLSDKTSEEEEKHFFGKLTHGVHTIYMIRLPREIETFLSLKHQINVPRTIWKVEFYNSRITTNNTLEGRPFIDYDILPNEYAIEEPVLSVYFGPEYDTQLEDYTFDEISSVDNYIKRYWEYRFKENALCLTQEIYDSFQKYISRSEYTKLVSEEIESDKILYIINTTEGDLQTIDMFSAAYSSSNNKYRNENTKVLRNDETKAENIFKVHDKMVLDGRSGTLLGFDGDLSDCPLFTSRYNSLPDSFYSRSSDTSKAFVHGRLYKHPEELEILGENPEISPYWIATDTLKKTMFNHFYIVKQGHGDVKPGGMVYLRGDRELELKVTPEKGHEFKKLTGSKYSQIGDTLYLSPESGTRLTVLFDEIKFSFNLVISCSADYPRYGESTTYSSSDLKGIGLKLWYYDYNLGEDILYTGEALGVSYTRPFKFWIDTKDSLYYIPGYQKFFFQEDYTVNLKKDGKYIVLDISETPQRLLNVKTLRVVGGIFSKTYTIDIETSSEVQVSTKKKTTLEYGDGFETMFAFENDRSLGVENIQVFNVDTGKIEESGVWELSEEDGVVTFKIQPRTKTNPDAGVKNNYKITVNV